MSNKQNNDRNNRPYEDLSMLQAHSGCSTNVNSHPPSLCVSQDRLGLL